VIRFVLVFLVCFAGLTAAFEATRGSAFERFVIEGLVLTPTAFLINTVTPGEHLELRGRTLHSAGSELHVTRGCEGVELILLLLSGIGAFPATLGQRCRGVLWGGALAYALAVTRLMVLHYTLRYTPTLWEPLHGLVMSLVPVMLLAVFFFYWSGSNRAAKPALPV
jgi:exosortase/archaeosortase family protein